MSLTNHFDEERFWNKVDTAGPAASCWEWQGNSCWEWQGKTNRNGYGIHRVRGQDKRAHRLAHWLDCSERPPVVLHMCDNRACCNPAHLEGGTQQENIADMVAKDRQAKGADNGRAKLEASDVKEIRRRYRKERTTYRKLAREYGLKDHSTIGQIIRRETWAHVE